MKKVAFVILSLIFSTTAFGQKTADGTATGQAEIVKPIGITNNGGTVLDFGKLIAPTGASGTATITAAAIPSRSVTNLDVLGTTITNAVFQITASANNSYSVTIPDIVLTGTGTDMGLTPISSLLASGNYGDQTLYVGGTLTVNDGQTEGDYTGTITVTVAYE